MWPAIKLFGFVILLVFSSVASYDLSNILSLGEFLLPSEPTSKPYIDRIVGGKNASIEDYPHQVSFTVTKQYDSDSGSVNRSYFCGGIIISKNYILTAAHCCQKVDPSTVVLRAGSSFRRNGTIIPVSEVIPHPQYDKPAFDKDVGVMRTTYPIEFNDVIKPIKLPPKGRPMKGRTKVQVSGWGRTMFGANSIPERLMSVEIPVVSPIGCFLSYPTVMTKNMWCGGNFFLGGTGTCQGDSGGAAIQDEMAVGIVSFSRGCGSPLAPSAFANIAAPTIRDFITEKTGL